MFYTFITFYVIIYVRRRPTGLSVLNRDWIEDDNLVFFFSETEVLMDKLITKPFEDGKVSLDVKVSVDDGTIWLSASDMAKLFNTSVSKVRRYIKSTYFNDNEKNVIKVQKMSLSRNYLVKTRPIIVYCEEIILNVAKKYQYDSLYLLECLINDNKKSSLSDIEGSNKYQTIIFDNGSISVDVKISPNEDTVWMTQNQIAALFETTRANIGLHISNIYKECELDANSVGKDFLHTASDNKNYLIQFYNLDMILAICYRVKGKRAIEFRRWVSNILKQYLIKGYVIDNQRVVVSQENYDSLKQQVIELQSRVSELEKKPSLIKERVFFAGEYFDAHSFLCNIMQKANSDVIVIDPYFDLKALEILSKTKKDITRKVYLSSKAELTEKDVQSFINQYHSLTLKKIQNFHDRFIVVDHSACYHIGTSLNTAGRKVFYASLIEDIDVVHSIINRIKGIKKEYHPRPIKE